MKIAWLLGIACAVVLHAGFLLFGGLIFASDKQNRGSTQEVELLGPEDVKEDEKPEDVPEDADKLEQDKEQPPDASKILQELDQPASSDAPALDALSLGAIEALLNGGGGGGDFAQALDLASGGHIGGTGKAGALEQQIEGAFSLSEIDQKPRAVFQAQPLYPSEMRGRKVDGSVSVLFIVDASGKVASPQVEKSSHPAFDKPALEAVKQWKFEPAIKGGQRVGCKMRVMLRFQPS